MKAQGLFPDFELMFERFIYNVIDDHSFALFVCLSVVGGVSLLFALNIINNVLEIIKLNLQEFYKNRGKKKWIG